MTTLWHRQHHTQCLGMASKLEFRWFFFLFFSFNIHFVNLFFFIPETLVHTSLNVKKNLRQEREQWVNWEKKGNRIVSLKWIIYGVCSFNILSLYDPGWEWNEQIYISKVNFSCVCHISLFTLKNWIYFNRRCWT